jgi:HK97 family phage major capsid protein
MNCSLFKRYKHLTALFTVIACAVLFAVCKIWHPVTAIAVVALYQLAMFAMSKRCLFLYTGALTPEQVKEFGTICDELKRHAELFPLMKDFFDKEKGGHHKIKDLVEQITGEKGLAKRVDELTSANTKLQKKLMSLANGEGQIRWIGQVPFVSDGCAKFLVAQHILDCAKLGEKALHALQPSVKNHDHLVTLACEIAGVEFKTALSATEIPLPTNFMSEVRQLIFAYGAARQYATIYPLGGGTTKLPRLKAGEDDFGYLGAGRTGGAGQAVPEKRAAVELVTFDPSKAGGLIRIPSEIEEDTFIQLGQFLATYIARQFAKLEDNTLFNADGSGTYGNQTGIIKYCQTNNAYLLSLAAGKVKPSDMALDDLRNLRSKVSAAVLSGMAVGGQPEAAYYMHPTWEPVLTSFNKYPNIVVFKNEGGKPTFDGWPVRWVGVTQPYGTAAAPSKQLAVFGDLRSGWFMGERGRPRIEISREVFFATDELAMRALESIDIENVIIDAIASLQTPAA